MRRGLARSRQQAHEHIAAGRVTVAGAPAAKPSRLVGPDEAVVVLGPPPRFVGRGGEKLEAALDRFGVEVQGRRAVDAGASTGGFTDCLLQRGAEHVVAVDVGYGQLHERLRSDPRVEVRERTNVRDLGAGDLGAPAEILVADLSFISLRTVLPAVLVLAADRADLVLLVKPQFEAGREEASRGRGVIADPAVWRRVLGEVAGALAGAGTAIMGAMASPLTGADGNVEFLLHARMGAPGPAAARLDDLLDAAVAEAERGVAVAAVGFVLHHERSQAVELAREAADWLLAEGHEVRLPQPDADLADLGGLGASEAELAPGLDVAVSLGGDGTMLRTVDLVAGAGVPILGVNVGQMGYLTDVEPSGVRKALGRFLQGEGVIEERMLLSVRVERADGAVTEQVAFNEAVVEKTPMGHTVRLAVWVDDEFFTTYAADGLIVATPTGSTAYAFSARGPIVEPTHRALLLTPVSPHMLFDRTLVLDPEARLRLVVQGHRAATLSVDGRNLGELGEGDAIVCTAAPRSARLVTFASRDFLQILKAKFGLNDR